VTEQRPAVFYLQREPFLHFHLVDGGRRRADVKTATGWRQLDVPHPISAARRRGLLQALRRVSRRARQSRRASPAPDALIEGAVTSPNRAVLWTTLTTPPRTLP
jgi:hypothetical protein